ncbi:hypothetical protein CVD28_17270 [Bacillus sp. M6-12]|uniref:hypothetical protein n=1 Tax=Bacillus sp. M6-12 TaxID=2054166 RepID=UPI000C756AAB|nr:hypothetical protein [Bacillus sp. M6-12]PLS16816.1 hypothetical protein CVD28_17270 [Bacillus sp. M6-12]
MLTFEEKLAIIQSFPELQRRDVSLGRVNFHYDESMHEKKIVIQHLHPNGNGFVFAGHLPESQTNEKGYVNIREFTEDKLRKMIKDSIRYLSIDPYEEVAGQEAEAEVKETVWLNSDQQQLSLIQEDLLWNVYSGLNLEESFGSETEAKRYLEEEGFKQKPFLN